MPSSISGAYVSCYAAGSDYVEATQKALSQLSADGLHPEEILQPVHEMESASWAMHVKETWADHVSSLLTQEEFEDVISNGGVVYGPFGSYA